MFGISTHCLHHDSLEVALDTLAPVTGIVEVLDDGYHYLENAEILESYSFRYFLHAPARGVNIASQLKPIRRASVEVIGQCFEIAGEADADVIIHPGYYAWQQERDRAIDQFKESLAELIRIADECAISFYIENMPNWNHFFLRYPDELDLIDGIGLALDTGHAHLCGCLEEFLKVPIAHFHIHDNDGKEDTHDAVGKGTIDFRPVMKAVKGDGAVPIIEVSTFKGVLESIEALKTV